MTTARTRSGARLLSCLPCLLALLLGGCRPNVDNDLRRLLSLEGIRDQEGWGTLSAEQLTEAIARYAKEADRTVAAEAQIGIYYELLAARYLERAMFVKAYESLVAAIERYPDRLGLYSQAAQAAGYVAKSKEALGPDGAAERLRWLAIAESNYRRVISADPGNATALYGLAVLYEFELGRSRDAEALLRRFLAIRTGDVDGWMLLGRSLYGQGRLEEALSAYEEAVASSRPENSIGGTPAAKRQAAEKNRDTIREELDAALKR
jgi:tetratricopeptide (TPR) repeat protein